MPPRSNSISPSGISWDWTPVRMRFGSPPRPVSNIRSFCSISHSQVAAENAPELQPLGTEQDLAAEPFLAARILERLVQRLLGERQRHGRVLGAEQHGRAEPTGGVAEESAQRVVQQRAAGGGVHLLVRVLQPVEPEEAAGEVGPGALGVRLELGRAPEPGLAEQLGHVRAELGALDPAGVGGERLALAIPFDPGERRRPLEPRRAEARRAPAVVTREQGISSLVERGHVLQRLDERGADDLAAAGVELREGDGERLSRAGDQHAEQLALAGVPHRARLERQAGGGEVVALAVVEDGR